MTGPSAGIELRGRAAELAAVARLLESAAAGHGAAVMFAGDTGSGKSALLAATVARADGMEILEARGQERDASTAFGGLRRMLRNGIGREDGLLVDAVVAFTDTLESQAGVPTGLLAISTALLALLRESTVKQPLLCLVDDAHLLDRPSLQALAFVARRIAGDRMAMVFATRGGDDVVPGVTRIQLTELDPTASRELLAALAPEGLADDVGPALVAIAGGNPRALVDLVESLTPAQRRGEACLPVSLPATSSLRREYRSMLSKLPAETRWLVLLLAADHQLDAGELVRATTASGLDLTALEPAERAGIVRVSGSAVEIAQPLLRAIAYDAATPSRRRRAHRLLADVLDPDRHRLRQGLHLAAIAEGPDPELAGRLAGAATADGADPSAASRGLERAAELTTDTAAAAQHLVGAAQLAWEAGEPHRARMLLRRLRAAEVPARVRARSELLIGEMELRTGGTQHAWQTLLAAARDLDQDRDAVDAMLRAGEATLQAGDYPRYPSVAQEALALRRPEESLEESLVFEQFVGMTAIFKGRLDEALGPLRKVIAISSQLDDAVSLLRGAGAALVLGDEHQGYRLAIRAAAVGRATGNAAIVPQALELAAAAEFALGRYDSATLSLTEALPLARATGQGSLASTCLAALALNAAVLGNRAVCLSRIREARRHTGSPAVLRPEALTEWALGVLDLVYGRPAKALVRLRSLLSGNNGKGQLVLSVAATPHLVEAAVRSGELRLARKAFSLFEPWTRITTNPTWLAHAARCRAMITEDDTAAEQHFREALRYHAAADSQFERARTELLFGQDLHRRRRHNAARDHLRLALEGFQQFDAEPWIEMAASALRASGDHVEQPTPSAAAELLTAQQLQVARLAASGATNRQVAAALFVSPRTVDHHMRNIFVKLGIRSRTELANLIM